MEYGGSVVGAPVDMVTAKPSAIQVAAAVFAVLAAMASPAWAQRLDAPFSGNTVPQGSPIGRVLPSAPPAVVPPVPGLTAPVVPGRASGSVDVRSVTINGATAFSQAQLGGYATGLVGRGIPLERIEVARAAILSRYRSEGYVLTTVGATVGPTGNLRFDVIEGHIAAVKLDGDIGPAGVQVLRFLNHLTEQTPIDNATLERWLLLAQDVPGVTLNAVLRPSAEDPGALTLVAQVQRQVANGLLTVDNRAFRQTGPQQGLLVLDANSFTQFGERTEVSLYHTNGNTQNFGQASEDFFIGGSGLHARLYYGYGEANPSDFLRTIGYKGFTTTFGIAGIYPLIRERQQTLNIVANLDAIETEVKEYDPTFGPLSSRQRVSRDSLRVGRIGAEYAIDDILAGGARPASNFFSLRLSQGMPFIGGTHNGNPLPGRTDEQVDFTKVTAEASRTQTLFSPWTGASIALRLRLLGQGTGSVLPPSEKFFLGGTELNRGFYSGQVTGDNALTGSVELQLNTGIDVPVFGRTIPVASQFYAFYDRGQTWENHGRTPGSADPNVRLSSEGIGARTNITRYTEFDIEGVIRNTRLPEGTPGVVKPLKADAVFWRVLTRF